MGSSPLSFVCRSCLVSDIIVTFGLSFLERLVLFRGVLYWRPSPALKLTQNGDLLQEGLVQLPLADGAPHEDATVRVAINCPQLDIRLGFDGGSAGRPVDQSKLTKAASLANAAIMVLVDIDLRGEKSR